MITSVDDIWPTKIVVTDNLLQEEHIAVMKNDLINKKIVKSRKIVNLII